MQIKEWKTCGTLRTKPLAQLLLDFYYTSTRAYHVRWLPIHQWTNRWLPIHQ